MHDIRGYGDASSGVVIVDASLRRSDETSPTRRLINAIITASGWSCEKTYTIQYSGAAEKDDCIARLSDTLLALKPKLIIPLGETASEYITGKKRRSGARGAVIWYAHWNAYVLETHHPATVLYSQSMPLAQDLIKDFEKIPRILTWAPGKALSEVTYKTVGSPHQAQVILNKIPCDGRDVVLDIETSSPELDEMDVFSEELLCFSVSWLRDDVSEETWVFPASALLPCARTGVHTDTCRVYHLKFPIEAHWTYQAGNYDTLGMWRYFEVLLPIVDDTMIMSYALDERPGRHGLKVQAREYLGVGFYEEEVKPYYKGRMHLLPPEKVHAYNAKDVAYTRRMADFHRSKLSVDSDSTKLYETVLMPAVRTFRDMQLYGINVDRKRLDELAYNTWFPRYLVETENIKKEASLLGWPTEEFNMGSHKQMSKMFFNILSVEPTKRSYKTGAPSLDKSVLAEIDHPFAEQILEWRALDGMIDYVLQITKHTKADGLLHPTAKVHNTRTGRTAYSDPAMQTIPKDYTVGADYARIREVFIPHNTETHFLLEADYEQAEVWVGWAFSQDPVLLDHLLTGDVHSATAENAFKTSRTEWSKDEWTRKRQNAKRIRFGLMYGEGAEKLASKPPIGIGCTVREAQEFIRNYRETYKVYTQWEIDLQHRAVKEGELVTPAGRKMRFPIVLDHRQLRQAVNFPIQATANDYNILSMIALHKILPQYDARIILNVHDSLVFEVPYIYADEVMNLVKTVMETPKFDGFPSLKVELKVGRNLGKMRAPASAPASVRELLCAT